MKNSVAALLKKIDEKFELALMGFFLIAISLIILLQIAMRLMRMSLSWPEELARYLYVWSVFLSLACAVRTGTVLRVDLLVESLPGKLKKGMELLLPFVDAAFFSVLFYHSLKVVSAVKMSNQTSPALEIPMYLVYLIVPCGFFLAALRSVQQIVFRLKDFCFPFSNSEETPGKNIPGA